MKKDGSGKHYLLARRLATEISSNELATLVGRGTSWYGSGVPDERGRCEDVYAGDCVDGLDVYHQC